MPVEKVFDFKLESARKPEKEAKAKPEKPAKCMKAETGVSRPEVT